MEESIRNQVGKGTILLSSSDVVVKVMGFSYVLIVVGHLSVYDYGLIKLALSIPVLLGLLTLGGLQPVTVSDISLLNEKGDIKGMRYLFSSFFSINIILSSLAFVLLLSSTFVFINYFHENILNLVRVLSLLFLVGPFRSLILLMLNVKRDFRSIALFNICEEGFKLALTVVFLLVFEYGTMGVILSVVLSSAMSVILFTPLFFSIKNKLLEGKLLSKGLFYPLEALRFHAKWSIFLSSMNNFMVNLRLWIIQFILGTEAVGIYGLAVSLLRPIETLVPIGKVILPILPSYINRKPLLTRLINSAIKYRLYAQVLLVFVAIITLPILTNHYLLKYSSVYGLFILCTFAFIPQSFSQMFGLIFHTLKLQRDLFFATTVNLVTVVIVLPISVYLLGIYGVALELFITQVAFLCSRYFALKKSLPEYKLQLSELITFTDTDKELFRMFFNRFRTINKNL